jgi:hypothetical protein
MKRVLLLSLGLMFMTATYVGCLPSDSGSTTGTAGTTGQGTAGSNQSGVAGTQGSAGSNPQGAAGTSPQGAAGNNSQGAAGDNSSGAAGDNTQGAAGNGSQGAAGSGAGGSSAGNGAGGNDAAGSGGRGGTTGTAGNGGRGGTTGTGGSTGGRGGSTGGSAAGTTGTGGGAAGTTGTGGSGNPVCDSVKSILEGFEYLLACGPTQSYSPLVCQNPTPAGQTAGTEYLTNGTRNLDKTMTVAGTSSQSCTITLHVQGVVEPKHYNNCTTYFGKANEGQAFGPANGMTGCYPSTQGAYNVYMMQVCDNTNKTNCTTGTRYYWNAINESEAHFSYKIDYTTTAITIKGGQTLWFLADDSNESAIKNCDATSMDGSTATSGKCNPITISGLVTTPGPNITQPYNGQFIVMHVVSAQ